jgi:hypothetical protein
LQLTTVHLLVIVAQLLRVVVLWVQLRFVGIIANPQWNIDIYVKIYKSYYSNNDGNRVKNNAVVEKLVKKLSIVLRRSK